MKRRRPLTPRQLDLLRLTGLGLPIKDIAGRLGVTEKTATNHRSSLFAALGFSRASQAMQYCFATGIITVADCAAALKKAGVELPADSVGTQADEEETRG